MSRSSTIALRQFVAAILILALTLSGVGRGLAASESVGPVSGIPGVTAPICHSGGGGRSLPSDPSHHDCCDACALMAPVMLPAVAILSRPAPVVHFASHANAVSWVPTLARARTPRQSQGPPAA